MSFRKFSAELIGEIKCYLARNWSFSVIIKELKSKGLNISKGQLSNIKNSRTSSHSSSNNRRKKRNIGFLSLPQLFRLKKMALSPNPPTLSQLSKRFKTSRRVIHYALRAKLGLKLRKKPRVHGLTDKEKQRRFERSRRLYKKLIKGQWKKILTSDEALFYLSEISGQRKVQYISQGQTRRDCERYYSSFSKKGIMVWLGMSVNGFTRPIFITQGVKINANLYIEKVLKPMIKHEIPRLYPSKKVTFHQDSAPSHTAKKTLNFLKENKIKFISPTEWMPKSPDASPLDYFVWGYLKNRLSQRKINTIPALKKAIRDEVKKVPPEFVINAMKSWPTRVWRIYKAQGAQIEY